LYLVDPLAERLIRRKEAGGILRSEPAAYLLDARPVRVQKYNLTQHEKSPPNCLFEEPYFFVDPLGLPDAPIADRDILLVLLGQTKKAQLMLSFLC